MGGCRRGNCRNRKQRARRNKMQEKEHAQRNAFPFERLPLELQTMIFQYATVYPYHIADVHTNYCQGYGKLYIKIGAPAEDIKLLQVNRLARATFIDCFRDYGVDQWNEQSGRKDIVLSKKEFQSTARSRIQIGISLQRKCYGRQQQYLLKDFRTWQTGRLTHGSTHCRGQPVWSELVGSQKPYRHAIVHGTQKKRKRE